MKTNSSTLFNFIHYPLEVCGWYFFFLFAQFNEKFVYFIFEQFLNIFNFFHFQQLFRSFVYVQYFSSVKKKISPMTKHKLYKHSFIGWRAYSVVHVNTTACNFNMKSLNDIQNNCTPSLYFCFASNKKGSLNISRSENISDFFNEDELFLLNFSLFLLS